MNAQRVCVTSVTRPGGQTFLVPVSIHPFSLSLSLSLSLLLLPADLRLLRRSLLLHFSSFVHHGCKSIKGSWCADSLQFPPSLSHESSSLLD